MSKTIYYPAVFHPEGTGYSVTVPDLEGCFTQGDTLNDAVSMAIDAVSLYLDGVDEKPEPSYPSDILVEQGDFVLTIPYMEKI